MRLALVFALAAVASVARAQDLGAADLAAPDLAAPSCPAGQTLCGTMHCAPTGNVCCASVGHEELSCPAGQVCNSDGTCGNGCMQGSAPTIASCGGDTCSCSAPCAHHKDCESGCCTTANYCAPLCVCQGAGLLYLTCDKSGTGYKELPVASGCQTTPGAPAADLALFLIAVLAGATALRRRSSNRP